MRSFIKPSYLVIFSSLVITTGLPMSQAQETAVVDEVQIAPTAEVNPMRQIKKINDTTYQLGEITINKKDRTIKLDAETEITAELVEYVLVTAEGKIHEALFITKARPIHLNIAFKLLGYKENKSLFREFVKNMPTNNYQTATDEEKLKSLFSINVSWVDEETKETMSHNLNDLIINEQTKRTMDKSTWSYGGSFMYQGKYVAEMNHDLIAIFTDRGAVANYAGSGREDDTLWHPVTEKMPARGTKVTLTITPDFPADAAKKEVEGQTEEKK